MQGSIYSFLSAEPSTRDQYFDMYQGRVSLDPEKALLLAILEDAIDSFQKYRSVRTRVGGERFREAEQWLLGDGDDWIFSFKNVCDLLGLDPNYVRRGLKRQMGKEVTGAGGNSYRGHRRREL